MTGPRSLPRGYPGSRWGGGGYPRIWYPPRPGQDGVPGQDRVPILARSGWETPLARSGCGTTLARMGHHPPRNRLPLDRLCRGRYASSSFPQDFLVFKCISSYVVHFCKIQKLIANVKIFVSKIEVISLYLQNDG